MTKQEAIKLLEVVIFMVEEQYATEEIEEALQMAIKALEMQCNLIRCKNCSHYSVHAGDYMCGLNVLAYVRKDDFCSRGERKEV